MDGLGNVDLHLVDSVDAAVEFKVWLGRRRDVLAFDAETEGLRFWSDKLRMVQFGDLDAGWAIPWERWGGVALEALKAYDGELVGHNGIGFDAQFIERYGDHRLPRDRVHDTRIMAHLIDPTRSTALKSLAAQLVDPKAAYASRGLDEAMSNQRWTWATVPMDFELYWAYGALDAVLTAHLHDVLRPQVRARYESLYELEVAAAWVVSDMEVRGCRVDVEFTERKLAEFEDYVTRAADWVNRTYGINPRSNQKVAKQLREDGVELTQKTEKGADRLDEDVLKVIDHPLARTVLHIRKTEKLAHTYLRNFIELADSDGRVHPSVNTLGARTGRMSMSDPALQTLPRDNAANPMAIAVRDCFIPGDGNGLIMCDYEQIEQRLMAHFASDAGMIAAFASGEDFFTAMARRIYGDDTIAKKDPRRQLTKNASYALGYGAGPAKFSLTAGVTEEQGRGFLDAFTVMFPGVRALQRRIELKARERLAAEGVGYVLTPMGRFQPSEENKFYALTNFLIQASGAEILKQALVNLDLVGLGEYLILPVHDEVVMDVPKEVTVEVAAAAREAMEQRDGWQVPLTCEVSGPYERWGEKYR